MTIGPPSPIIARPSPSTRTSPTLTGTGGLAFSAEGDFEAAIADYTESIRLSPADASSYIHRGEARSQTEDFEAAAAD